MNSPAEILRALEARSERAIVQELRLMVKEVRAMRSSLTPEDRAHADALLLKLGRLEDAQRVAGVSADKPSLQQPDLASVPSLAVPPSAFSVIVCHAEHDDVEA
jgi:hypothetical protein